MCDWSNNREQKFSVGALQKLKHDIHTEIIPKLNLVWFQWQFNWYFTVLCSVVSSYIAIAMYTYSYCIWLAHGDQCMTLLGAVISPVFQLNSQYSSHNIFAWAKQDSSIVVSSMRWHLLVADYTTTVASLLMSFSYLCRNFHQKSTLVASRTDHWPAWMVLFS